jgi:putative tricarboxylic transport membrane protein
VTDAAETTEPALGDPQGRPAGPFAFGAGIVLVSGVLLSQVFAIDTTEGFSPQGPRFLPLVVLTLMLVLGLVYLAQQAAAVRRGGSLPAEPFTHLSAAAVLVGILVVYAFVLGPVGYVPATALFFVAAARTMGSRHLPRDVVVGVGLSLLVYLSFTRALGVFLPQGVFPL